MKKITAISILLMALSSLPFIGKVTGSGATEADTAVESEAEVEKISDFEQAVQIIKKYEGLHQSRHWPLVGYGHKVLPGEKFNRNRPLSEAEAEALLRKDLLKNCAVFREYGADSLLLGTLAYNIGSGAAKRSPVAAKLRAGNRDIRESYLAHSRYRGKQITSIRNRRIEEFDALFIKETNPKPSVKSSHENNLLSFLSTLGQQEVSGVLRAERGVGYAN